MCACAVRLTWFTLDLSLAVAQAGAAHHVTVLSMAVPLLPDAVVVSIVMAPFCPGGEEGGESGRGGGGALARAR